MRVKISNQVLPSLNRLLRRILLETGIHWFDQLALQLGSWFFSSRLLSLLKGVHLFLDNSSIILSWEALFFFKSDLHFLDFLFLFLISLSFWVGSRYCILESLVVPLLNLNSWWRHSNSSCIPCTLRKSRWIQQFSQSCYCKHSFPFALFGKCQYQC